MKAPEDNPNPWNPNMQSTNLPTYAEATSAGPPYPAQGPNHPAPYPTTHQPSSPMEAPNHFAPYPTHQPPYPTQTPHPMPQMAPNFTNYSQPISGYQTTHQHYQTDEVPVIHHPTTHIQHIVTSAPRRNRYTVVILVAVIALIVIITIIKLSAIRR